MMGVSPNAARAPTVGVSGFRPAFDDSEATESLDRSRRQILGPAIFRGRARRSLCGGSRQQSARDLCEGRRRCLSSRRPGQQRRGPWLRGKERRLRSQSRIGRRRLDQGGGKRRGRREFLGGARSYPASASQRRHRTRRRARRVSQVMDRSSRCARGMLGRSWRRTGKGCCTMADGKNGAHALAARRWLGNGARRVARGRRARPMRPEQER